MIAHAQLAADLDLSQRPTDEGAKRADRDDLPKAALHQRCQSQTVFQIGRRDVDQPRIEGALMGSAPEYQNGPQCGEERRRDTEEANVERSDPEVEQIAADQRPSADPVFSFETEHSHLRSLRMWQPTGPSGPEPTGSKLVFGGRGRDRPRPQRCLASAISRRTWQRRFQTS